MNGETLKKFAEDLKKKREEKSISLQQISARTRIDIKFLEAIETGNFSIQPEVYMRAFLREYAAAIDMKQETIMKRYDNAKSGITGPEEVSDEEIPEGEDEQIESKREFSTPAASMTDMSSGSSKTGKSVNPLLIIIPSLIALAVIIYFLFFYGSSGQIVYVDTPETVQTEEKPKFEIKETKKTEPLAAVSDSLKISAAASDTVWIRVILDEVKIDEYTLYPGRRKNFTVKNQLKAVVGNAGGIKFYLNGKELEAVGRPGEVKNCLITKDGLVSERKNIRKTGEDGN